MNYACRHHSHIFFYCVSKCRKLLESVQNRASHRWGGWWVRYRRWGPLLYGVRCAHRATRWSMLQHPWQGVAYCCAVCTYVYVLCAVVYVYVCVLYLCVYVALCSISVVCLAFFGNLFGISTNDPPFSWLFRGAVFLTFLVVPCYNVIINQGGNGYG